MRKSLLVLLILSGAPLLPAEAVARPACARARPAVPDEATARRIAEAEIATRPHLRREKYVLHVMADDEDPAYWSAFQSPPPPPPAPPGYMTGTFGGGGLSMRIDRCTGAVSDTHYQR